MLNSQRLRISEDAIIAVGFVDSVLHRREISDGGFSRQLCENRPQCGVAD